MGTQISEVYLRHILDRELFALVSIKCPSEVLSFSAALFIGHIFINSQMEICDPHLWAGKKYLLTLRRQE